MSVHDVCAHRIAPFFLIEGAVRNNLGIICGSIFFLYNAGSQSTILFRCDPFCMVGFKFWKEIWLERWGISRKLMVVCKCLERFSPEIGLCIMSCHSASVCLSQKSKEKVLFVFWGPHPLVFGLALCFGEYVVVGCELGPPACKICFCSLICLSGPKKVFTRMFLVFFIWGCR